MLLKVSVKLPVPSTMVQERRREYFSKLAERLAAAEYPARLAAGRYVASKLHIRGQSGGAVATSFGAKVHYRRPDAPPVMAVYCNIPWMRIHETGGVVRGLHGKGLLIPVGNRRLGPKAFQRHVTAVLRQTNVHFMRGPKGVLIGIKQRVGSEWKFEAVAFYIPEARLRKRLDFSGGEGWVQVKREVATRIRQGKSRS